MSARRRLRGPATCAVILAAGSGARARRGAPATGPARSAAKQFQRAGGRSLLYHACSPFLACRAIGGLVVVVPAGREVEVVEELDDAGARKLVAVVPGGATRTQSARAGLAALPAACTLVLLHDAARPFASVALVSRIVRAARAHGAVVPVMPVSDAMVELDARGRLRRYVDRERLRAVQTPQGFRRRTLEAAFARRPRADYQDDAAAVRAAGGRVALVHGEAGNVKITTAEQLAQALLKVAAAAEHAHPRPIPRGGRGSS